MTRTQLEQAVYRRLNKNTASIDTLTQTRIREFLNTRMRALLVEPGLTQLRNVRVALTTVAGQSDYGLGSLVASVQRIVDPTNERVLVERTAEWYRQADPVPTSGTPDVWVPLGYQPTKIQPPSDTVSLTAVSTAAGDTTQVVDVEILLANGNRTTANATLNGTTAVNVATGLTSPVLVTKFSLRTTPAGAVTLNAVNSTPTSTPIQTISIGETEARAFTLALWPTPSAAITYTVDAQRVFTEFFNDTDVPPLPLDFHPMLVDGACAEECLHMNDPRRDYYEQQWRQWIAKLYRSLHGRVSYGVQSGQVPLRTSLGPWFPA